MKYQKSKKTKFYKKPKTIKKVIKSYKRKNLNLVIKKEMYKIKETNSIVRDWTMSPATLQGLPTTTTLAGNLFVLNPSDELTLGYTIYRGQTDANYIGNKVRTAPGCKLDIVLTPNIYHNTYNNNPRPQVVRLYIFKDKRDPTVTMAPSDLPDFFANGSTTQGFSGTLLDMCKRLDKSNYTYLGSYTWKIGFDGLNRNDPWTTPSLGVQVYPNNDYKMNVIKSIDITKYMPKIVSYTDGGICTNAKVFGLIQTVNSDMSVNAFANTALQVACQITYNFKDF